MPNSKEIIKLIKPFIDKGLMLNRSVIDIEKYLLEFVTIYKDNHLIACAGLRQYPNNITEIYTMAVDANYQKQGYSQKLLQKIYNKSISFNTKTLFAISKYQKQWFLSNGFTLATLADIPSARYANFDKKRNSDIFIKNINKDFSR